MFGIPLWLLLAVVLGGAYWLKKKGTI